MASQGRGIIWAERAVVALILASLAGTVHLVISIHRRALHVPGPVAVEVAAVPPTVRPVEPPPIQVVAAPPRPKAPDPPKPAPPAEDPTKKALAELSGSTAHEIAETGRIDARAVEMEKTRDTAISGAKAWRRREMLVKQQLSKLVRQADQIDRDVDELAAQRDVLARERDALKAALAKVPGEGSFAVLPYKGENGTWRRPIVLECTNGSVTLRPEGPTFSMLDLSGLINPRSSPVIVSIARELLKIQGSASPDGAPVVPYFVFLVRPDGVRPYYEARARLEPLGIAFGYELIDQELKVDVPDFDNLATWDGSTPLDVPPSKLAALGSGTGSGSATGSSGLGGPSGNGFGRGGDGSGNLGGGGLSWPGAGAGASGGSRSRSEVGPLAGTFGASGGSHAQGSNSEGQGKARGAGNGGGSPDDFVWPSARGGGGEGAGAGSASDDPWSGGSKKNADRSAGTGTGKDREPGGMLGTGSGSGSRMGSGFDQLPPLEPAGPSAGSRSGGGVGLSEKPSGGLASGMKPGTSGGGENRVAITPRGLGTSGGGGGVDLSAGAGLKALADGYEAGRPQGPGGGSLDSGDQKSRGVGGPGAVAEPGGGAGAGRPLVSGDRNSRGTGTPGSSSELGGSAGAASRGTAAEPGGSSPADLAAAAAEESGAALGKPNPGLMWGGGSPGAGASGAGAGGSDPKAARGAGSTGGAKALLGLGGSQGAANAGSLNSAASGGIGLGLGSLAGSSASSGGGASGSSSSSGGSGLSLGSTGSPGGSSSSSARPSEEAPFIKGRDEGRPSPPIEVPFEIVVACGSDGLVIHPGGYRITEQSLKAERKNSLLIRQLVAVAVQRAETDPSIRPKPRVSFLVENNGGSTFWEARRQVLFAGLDWPMTLHVVGVQNPRLLNQKEAW